jgi:C-5 cytosine-specific DNA methylase
MKKPLCIDLFCGLGGWAEGFLAEGYDVIGFDIERHAYGDDKYPGQLVLQDVRTLHGFQFKRAAVIVASPPCEANPKCEICGSSESVKILKNGGKCCTTCQTALREMKP